MDGDRNMEDREKMYRVMDRQKKTRGDIPNVS